LGFDSKVALRKARKMTDCLELPELGKSCDIVAQQMGRNFAERAFFTVGKTKCAPPGRSALEQKRRGSGSLSAAILQWF
jgi:hypothetical protein